MKQITLALLIGWGLLLWPQASHARETRVYVGFSIGTAIVVGSGIASFNIGYNQRIGKQEPESPPSKTDSPPALAELKREGEETVPKTFPDWTIHSQSDSPSPIRFELPLFILRW
jgi:hypothetical protein